MAKFPELDSVLFSSLVDYFLVVCLRCSADSHMYYFCLAQFPYNPLLILVGVAMGYYHTSLGFLGKAAVLVSELNPNGVIAIFLPALIFESAFKT